MYGLAVNRTMSLTDSYLSNIDEIKPYQKGFSI
jgi:hypothetical protein